MKSQIQITAGIPVPSRQVTGAKNILATMRVGDSFAAPSQYRASYLRHIMIKLGFKAVSRTINTKNRGKEIRVWRIK